MLELVEVIRTELIEVKGKTEKQVGYVIYDYSRNRYYDKSGNQSAFRNHLLYPYTDMVECQKEIDRLNQRREWKL